VTQALPPTASGIRRAKVRAHLIELGMHWADAELWLTAWQSSSNMDAEGDSPDFWDRGARWVTDAWTAGQQAPTI
jgi:hypothetical protein